MREEREAEEEGETTKTRYILSCFHDVGSQVCHATLCHVTWCHVMSCHVMSCHMVSYYLRSINSSEIILYEVIVCHVMEGLSHHIIAHEVIIVHEVRISPAVRQILRLALGCTVDS